MEVNLSDLNISGSPSSEETQAPAAVPVETQPPERNSSNAKRYEYEPLETGSIRLLLLLEADDDADDLECALLHVELSEASEYTALSYVWGDKRSPCAIYIADTYLSITANLDDALRHLRRRDKPVCIWVDALCIDQLHTEERNHQVQQMRQIYESARDTVVYLGRQTGDHTGYSAWNFLERNSTWALNESNEKDYTLPEAVEDRIDFRGDIHDVYRDILNRPWFSRVWVFQEVVVSKEVTIQCGPRGVSWDDFCKLVILEKRAHDRYGLSLQQQDLSDSLRRIWQARVDFHLAKGQEGYLPGWYTQTCTSPEATTDILDMLVRARHLMASDPRDKIFALLGISTGFDWKALDTINYATPTSDVFTKFALDLMTTRKDYRLLSYLNKASTINYLEQRKSLWTDELDYWTKSPGDPSWRPQPWQMYRTEADIAQAIIQAEECQSQITHLIVQYAKCSGIKPIRLPSWVPNWHCIHISTFEPRAIVEVVAQQPCLPIEVDKYRVFLPSGILAIHGSIIGTLHQAISSASVLGNDELKFEELKRKWQQSPVYQKHPLEAQILTLWAHLLDATAVIRLDFPFDSDVNMVRQSPELRRRKEYGIDDILSHPPGGRTGRASNQSSFLNYLDMETCPPKAGSVEAHLVSRACKTAEWSDESQPAFKIVNDSTSIIDQRAIGVCMALEPGTSNIPEAPRSYPVLLPSSAKFGDLVVHFPGAKVPFLVRPKGSLPARVDEIGLLLPPGALPFRNYEDTYLECHLVGECWISGFEEIGFDEGKLDCVFGLV